MLIINSSVKPKLWMGKVGVGFLDGHKGFLSLREKALGVYQIYRS